MPFLREYNNKAIFNGILSDYIEITFKNLVQVSDKLSKCWRAQFTSSVFHTPYSAHSTFPACHTHHSSVSRLPLQRVTFTTPACHIHHTSVSHSPLKRGTLITQACHTHHSSVSHSSLQRVTLTTPVYHTYHSRVSCVLSTLSAAS